MAWPLNYFVFVIFVVRMKPTKALKIKLLGKLPSFIIKASIEEMLLIHDNHHNSSQH